MSTDFKGARHYDEQQREWELAVCPLDWAIDHETDIKRIWAYYKDAHKALSAYIKELIRLQAELRLRMAQRVSFEDTDALYGG